jgi:hypothetical protein
MKKKWNGDRGRGMRERDGSKGGRGGRKRVVDRFCIPPRDVDLDGTSPCPCALAVEATDRMSVATCCCKSSRWCGVAGAAKDPSCSVRCSLKNEPRGGGLAVCEASKVAATSKGGSTPHKWPATFKNGLKYCP